MSQTALTVQKPGLTAAALTAAAADGVNGNFFINNGRTLLIIKNGGASSITATVTSVPDPYNRTGDVTVTVAAGAEMVVGPFEQTLFNQASGVTAGGVQLSYSGATSVTVSAVSM